MKTENPKVYLSGGLRSQWRDQVKQLDGFKWLDPKNRPSPTGVDAQMSANEYGAWNKHHIEQSDVLFVYVEKTNPSCVGLAVEAGYAKGLGKTVIIVLEPNNEIKEDRYLQYIQQFASVTFEKIEDGINYLASFK